MEQLLEELKSFGLNAGIQILWAIVILFVGFKLIKWLEKALKKGKILNKIDKTVKSFLISFIIVALKILVILMAASELGIPMTSIVTIVASASVAIGLALQGGLSNLAGGLMILIFHPFKVGDYIKATSDEGTVAAISLFYTILTTIDNKRVMIPNGTLTNETITNYTVLPERRIDNDFCVSYSSDIETVKDILNNVIENEKLVLKDKEIFVRLTAQADSSLIFTTRCWVNHEDYFEVKFNIIENVKKEFDKNNIEIPFNQLDVHLKK